MSESTTREDVVRIITEKKAHFMSVYTKMTKVLENGSRINVLMWFERLQKRVYYREVSSNQTEGERCCSVLFFNFFFIFF
jgi:hypothetical protein